MPNWSRSKWSVCAIAIASYFSAALWLKHSYVEPPKPLGLEVIRLERPFFEWHGSDIAFSVRMPSLDHLSDTMQFQKRSPFVLYENNTRLGPPHTEHADIVKYGRGRFSHWDNSGFIFSSSDGSSPRSNGRTYWAVIPLPGAE